MNTTAKYPPCFPDNIEDLITADGAGPNRYTYYRISQTGLINRDAFKGTYETNLNRNSFEHNRDLYRSQENSIDIGDFSTSGYEKPKDIKRLYKCIKKHTEGPVIMAGRTSPECGLSLRTKESRTRKCHDSHIDWWIYEDAHPEALFKEVKEEEI